MAEQTEMERREDFDPQARQERGQFPRSANIIDLKLETLF
jgi:hypothetical protein